MNAPKITIASLSIDPDKLINELKATKKGIAEITKEQKAMKDMGKENTEAFIRNEAAVKTLRTEYNRQVKQLQAVTDSNTRLTEQMSREVTSVDAAIDNNKQLRQIRNQLNTSTVEGAEAVEAINAKIDKNTDLVNDNGSALEKLKMNVGNYKEGMSEALAEINPFNGGLSGFISRASEAGGAGALLKNSLKGMATGLAGVTKASLAFLATPIGAVIGVLAGAFLLVKNAMNRSEEATNKIKRAFSAFTGILSTVLKGLEPVGEFIIDVLVESMEMAEVALYKAMDGLARGLELLGFKDTANDLRSFNKEVQEGAANAKELSDAEAQLTVQQRKARLIILDYQKDAEKLRQIRDDDRLTMAERHKANEDLGKLLELQLAEEMRIAQAALVVANLRIKMDGEQADALDQQAEALTEIADIQERIAGQESEQLTNRNALYRESADLAKQAADKATEIANKAISEQKAQLDLFIAQQGTKAKTLKEELDDLESQSDRRLAILDAELKNRNLTQTEYDLELLNLKTELIDKQTELSIDNASRELSEYIDSNMSKLDSDKLLTQEVINEETRRLQGIADKRAEFALLELEAGVTTRQEYNAAIKEIDDENYEAQQELALERKEQADLAAALDFENKLELDRERLETDLALNLEYLNKKKADELANAEKIGADKTLIEQRYAQYEVEIRSQVAQNKIDLASDALGNLVSILGQESAAGKAVAVAQATIDTYSSAVSAFNSLSGIPIVGPVLGGIAAAAAVAGGLATVSKIVSTPKPTIPQAERGMMVGGNRHAQGGTLIEAELGEAVMTRGAVKKHGALLSAINVDGGGVPFMERGGINGSNSFSNSGIVDYDLLSAKISEANRNLPAPKVSVEEFNEVSDRVNLAESDSEL